MYACSYGRVHLESWTQRNLMKPLFWAQALGPLAVRLPWPMPGPVAQGRQPSVRPWSKACGPGPGPSVRPWHWPLTVCLSVAQGPWPGLPTACLTVSITDEVLSA